MFKVSVPVIALTILSVLQVAVCTAFAHTDEIVNFGMNGGGKSGSPRVGLEERLGNKISLDLKFRDETGKQVTLAELVTCPTIILPVYYSCTNVCNFLQSGLARTLPDVRLKPGVDYRVISVSFDETETPELASKYKKTYITSMNTAFPESGWRFLTGDNENIMRLTQSAGYRFERKGRDFIHPVVSIVISGDGTIVRYLYGTNFLSKDLSLAILEAKEGKIGGTVRKIVGFCFSFDPEKKSYVFNLLKVSATTIFLTAGAFLAFLVLGGKKRKRGTSGRT